MAIISFTPQVRSQQFLRPAITPTARPRGGAGSLAGELLGRGRLDRGFRGFLGQTFAEPRFFGGNFSLPAFVGRGITGPEFVRPAFNNPFFFPGGGFGGIPFFNQTLAEPRFFQGDFSQPAFFGRGIAAPEVVEPAFDNPFFFLNGGFGVNPLLVPFFF